MFFNDNDQAKDLFALMKAQEESPEIAPCTNDPDLFFPAKTGIGPDWRAIVKACGSCSIQVQCAEYAIKHDEYGVWGGMSAYERAKIRELRQRAA